MTTEFHRPNSFEIEKHVAAPGARVPNTYWVNMSHGEGRRGILLPGVYLSPEAVALFESKKVVAAHIETLVTDSVGKKALGYPNYVVMGVELADRTKISVVPRQIKSVLWKYVTVGIGLTTLGLFLLSASPYAFALVLLGTHVLRTGLSVPHKNFWGHFPTLKNA